MVITLIILLVIFTITIIFFHREGGPAFERANGQKEWYLNGALFETKESYFDALSYEGKRICLISEDFLNA